MFISRWLYRFLTTTCLFAVMADAALLYTEFQVPSLMTITFNFLLLSYLVQVLLVFSWLYFSERRKR